MKMCFFLTLLIIMLTVLSGQSIDSLIIVNKEKIERANNHWDYKSMEESRNNFVRRLGASNKDWLINYYIAYCDYRLVNYYSNSEGNQDTEKAARYLEDGIKRLNESNDANQEFSDGHALLAALLGAINETSAKIDIRWYDRQCTEALTKSYIQKLIMAGNYGVWHEPKIDVKKYQFDLSKSLVELI